MTLRVVAIPLIAAICLGSPAMASTTTDEQQVRGHGPRDRSAGSSGGDSSQRRGGNSGDNRSGTAGDNRSATPRGDGEQRTATRRGDGDQRSGDSPRVAVSRDGDRDRDRDRNNGPIIITRNRPNVNINIGSYRGPRYYAPWSLFYGAIGFSNYGYYGPAFSPYPSYGGYGYGNYAYGNGYGYGPGPYSPWQASGYDIGGIRLRIRPRDAQVFVDGYYAGLVDDFDGTFQSLRLEQGGHKLEIHMPGFEDLELDVHVQPGRTITLSEVLRPRP
jgi:hypothetical protein